MSLFSFHWRKCDPVATATEPRGSHRLKKLKTRGYMSKKGILENLIRNMSGAVTALSNAAGRNMLN